MADGNAASEACRRIFTEIGILPQKAEKNCSLCAKTNIVKTNTRSVFTKNVLSCIIFEVYGAQIHFFASERKICRTKRNFI